MKSRILFSYVSIGSGHQQATKAIEKHLKTLDKEIVTLCVNSFSFSGFIVTNIVSFIYLYTIKLTPEFWGYLYDNIWIKKKIDIFHSMINWGNSIRFYFLIKKFKPSVIVCTQAIPCGIVASLKKRGKIDIPLVAVMTDFVAHIYWIYKEVDIYFVATEDMKVKLIEHGINESRIIISGIPIDHDFNNLNNKQEVLKKEKLSDKIKIILLMGGSRGIGKLEEIVSELHKIDVPYQIIAVAGNNKKLRKRLDLIKVNSGNHLKVYGYVEHLNEIMDISDLIITKPGGLTSSEALVKGLPMVIVNPIPGQEESNSRFLVKNGAAVRVDDINELGGTVKMLFNDPEKLQKMKQAALKLAKPMATRDIGNIIFELGGKYENRSIHSK
ncbi:MAG: glycosyltransferase [bacterium]|nr:glycosyltransferase [bacterium]